MANEITCSASLAAAKSGAAISNSGSKQITMTANPMQSVVQNIGTTTEALVFGDIVAVKYLFIKNLDATNYIEVGLNTPVTQIFAKLLAGEFALLPVGTSVIYAKANTAACNLLVAATDT